MKKITIILVMCLMSAISMAQAPQAFAFQSTLKHDSGEPYANDTITVQFDIYNVLDTVYSETHNGIITSASGYFSANVGQGDSLNGTFSNINWATSSYWLNLSVDTGGGMVSLGASQLLSVPYALNAGKPASVYKGICITSNTDTITTTILFDSTLINIGNNYVNGRYMVPDAGVYMVSMYVVGPNDGTTNFNLLLNSTTVLASESELSPGSLILNNNIFQFDAGDEIRIDANTWMPFSIQPNLFQIIQIK